MRHPWAPECRTGRVRVLPCRLSGSCRCRAAVQGGAGPGWARAVPGSAAPAGQGQVAGGRVGASVTPGRAAPRSACSAPGTSRAAASAPAPGRPPSGPSPRAAGSGGAGIHEPGPCRTTWKQCSSSGRSGSPGRTRNIHRPVGVTEHRAAYAGAGRVGCVPRRARAGPGGRAPPARRRPARWAAARRAGASATRWPPGPGRRSRPTPSSPARGGSRRWAAGPAADEAAAGQAGAGGHLPAVYGVPDGDPAQPDPFQRRQFGRRVVRHFAHMMRHLPSSGLAVARSHVERRHCRNPRSLRLTNGSCNLHEKYEDWLSGSTYTLCDQRKPEQDDGPPHPRTSPRTDGRWRQGRDGEMDELPIGRRVAYWRGRRKMSQQVFADRLGKSKSWVDKVERGRTPARQVLRRLRDRRRPAGRRAAAAGQGPGAPPRRAELHRPGRGRGDPGRAGALRPDQRVLRRARPSPPPLDEMRKAVNHAWLTYQHAQYGVLARTLPKLLRDAQAADTAYAAATQAPDGGPPARAGLPDRLVGAAQARRARAVLARRRPVDRGRPSAPATSCWPGSPPTGSATRCSRSAGPGRRSRSTSTSPTGSRPAATQRGHPGAALGLRHAAAAGRDGRRPDRRLGHRARPARRRRGGGHAARRRPQPLLDLRSARPTWSCTGPPPPWSWARAGRPSRSTSSHRPEPAFNALLPERRAHHFLDIARGLRPDRRRRPRPARCCCEGDRLAPSEIRCRPIAHEVMSDVLRRTRGTPPAPVAELAEHMGVGV